MSVKVYTKGTTFQRRLRLVGKTSIQPNRTGVVREASSRTLPDVLMLENPDVQQIAAGGALAPLADFGLSADGYAKGVVAASTYQGKLHGLQPVANTIGLFYDKDMLDKAGIKPPTTWDELKSAAKKLTSGKRYGIALLRTGHPRGNLAVPAVHVVQRRRGEEHSHPRGCAGPPVVGGPRQERIGLEVGGQLGQADVNDQFKAGNAAMMINGAWQFPVLDEKKSLRYGVVQVPVPKACGTPVVLLGGETWTVPQTGSAQRQVKAAKVVACLNSDKSQLSLATQRRTVLTKTALMDQFAAQQPRMKALSRRCVTPGPAPASWARTGRRPTPRSAP